MIDEYSWYGVVTIFVLGMIGLVSLYCTEQDEVKAVPPTPQVIVIIVGGAAPVVPPTQ